MRRAIDPLLLLVLAASLGLNVYQYRTRVSYARPLQPLVVGTVLPALEGKSPNGAPSRVSFQRPTILYVFSPTCIWCEKNLRNVEHLRNVTHVTYDFVAVSIQSFALKKWLADKKVEWPIVTDLDPSLARKYGLGSTPQTIVVERGGRVLHVWSGAFGASVGPEIEKVFHISLPERIAVE